MSPIQDDFEAMIPLGIQANDMDCADYVRRMSDTDCQKALLTATKLAGRYRRFRQIVLKDQELILKAQKEAAATNDEICKLAVEYEELAGSKAAKKNLRTSGTTRLERSLATLKQKLESLESSNVSQKDVEAREKEIDALKAENAKLLENVRDAHADRQRALEDNVSLREQLQKARAEKQADGPGKKKKNK